MSANIQNRSNGPWLSKPAAYRVLDILHYAYPILLLVFFIFAFATRTILAAKAANTGEKQSPKVQFGPGGKPLPFRSHSYKRIPQIDFSRSRKLVFQWLSVFVCLTFAANATIVILQALFRRHEGWWCGQAVTVSRHWRCISTRCIVLIGCTFRYISSDRSSSIPCSSFPSLTRYPHQLVPNSQLGYFQLFSS